MTLKSEKKVDEMMLKYPNKSTSAVSFTMLVCLQNLGRDVKYFHDEMMKHFDVCMSLQETWVACKNYSHNFYES